MTDRTQIIGRIRRKVEILRLDAKARHSPTHHDLNELLTLLDMLERAPEVKE